MFRTSSRLHTCVYSIILSVVIICMTIHLSTYVASFLDPHNPSNMIYMSVLISVLLAPPASLMMAIYSRRLILVQEELRELAVTDSLTGLYNRRAFEELYKREIARIKRHHSSASLVLFDIDHFKDINNTHGHVGGDVALQSIAQKIRKIIRFGTDEAARWGGEEFVILLGETNQKEAGLAANRIRRALETMKLYHNDQLIRITASFGVTECVPDEALIDAVARADKCLRYAKKRGRNTVIIYPKAKIQKAA